MMMSYFSLKFYLNVVGYKGLIIRREIDKIVLFYLNVVGYKGRL